MAKVMEWSDVASVARQIGGKRRVDGSGERMRDEDVVLNVLNHLECRVQNGVGANVDPVPVPMRMPCPSCHELHIDEGDFATKPHHTHACQSCGAVWRPAVVATVGVRFLPGFKNV